MFLVIDNYDSFTYNLVQYLGELSVEHEITKELIVKRNDEITLDEIIKINPGGILLSPGPGNPDQSGICLPCLLYTSPSPRDRQKSRMPSSA